MKEENKEHFGRMGVVLFFNFRRFCHLPKFVDVQQSDNSSNFGDCCDTQLHLSQHARGMQYLVSLLRNLNQISVKDSSGSRKNFAKIEKLQLMLFDTATRSNLETLQPSMNSHHSHLYTKR